MISLFKFFNRASVKQRRREPMGGLLRVCAAASLAVVCMLVSSFDVYAFTNVNKTYNAVYLTADMTSNYSDGYFHIPSYSDDNITLTFYRDLGWFNLGNQAGRMYVTLSELPEVQATTSSLTTTFSYSYTVTSTLIIAGREYDLQTAHLQGSSTDIVPEFQSIYVDNWNGSCHMKYTVNLNYTNMDGEAVITRFRLRAPKVTLEIEDLGYSNTEQGIKDLEDSLNDQSDETQGLIQEQTQQQQQFHDQDQDDATSAGEAMSGVASDLENVKNKWEILWYPIEFTNKVMGAFQGTSTAAYSLEYGNVSGYTYNESSGLLEPVYAKTRSSSAGGATITFPEYTMPVLNVKLWDSYSYDMSSLKDQFPVLFDALYVIISMLEVMWFVGFLRKKYHEVFRG